MIIGYGDTGAVRMVGSSTSDLVMPERDWVSKVKMDAEGYLDGARTMYGQPSLDEYALIERISPITSQRMQDRGLQRGGSNFSSWVLDKITGGQENNVPRDWSTKWDTDRDLWSKTNNNPTFSRGILDIPGAPSLVPVTDGLKKAAVYAGLGFLAYKMFEAHERGQNA